MPLQTWLFAKNTPAPVVLVRLMIGWVFLSEGIQKFLFPVALGVGRFEKIGFPAPHVLAPFVGFVEIIFGFLLIVGLLVRLATIPLLIDISVAIVSTKIPMLARAGFWATMHEARTDFCMFLGLIFLLAVGGGRALCWSIRNLPTSCASHPVRSMLPRSTRRASCFALLARITMNACWKSSISFPSSAK